ncbi:hypothetical protein JTE90_025998 [Oedothorax gibbosus]|uniref:Protein kinase domain-containing protein n=1 Tax=Oedothorax gibbosus TaxID=931172 RepID=A0AAV6UHZ7_9ARAC|nr:hypothetical protein JTE90_025998 [Oedothorax gibbosus]
MTCEDGLLSRRQVLAVLTVPLLFLLQVSSWTIPTQRTRLSLPMDFPPLLPFYGVSVLRTEGDPENLQLEFQIRRQRVHLQDGRGESKAYKRQLLEIDRKNGSLWIVTRPEDLDVFTTAMQGGKIEPTVSISATIGVTSTPKSSPKRTEQKLELKFVKRTPSYCEHSEALCFPFSSKMFEFQEGSIEGQVFHYLQNFNFESLCPGTDVEYAIGSGYPFIGINTTTRALVLSTPPDAEKTSSFTFNVTCSIDKETYVTTGAVKVVDVNNHAPTTQSGKSSETIVQEIKPGQTSHHFHVRATDKDHKSVNGLEVRIENDTLDLFFVEEVKIYGILEGLQDYLTFLQAEIMTKKMLQFPEREYRFDVIVEDTKLKRQERKVTYNVVLINMTETELVLKDVYEVNISRNSEEYARILQLSRSSLGYTFQLDIGEKSYDFLAITKQTGILYVKDPNVMPSSSIVRRNILWKGPEGKSGSILLFLSIEDENTKSCEPSSKWCSFHPDENQCLDSCGKGSPSGPCSWRSGSLTSDGPRSDFATCSSNLESCPDGDCDELEMLEPSLCPQDCATKFAGEVVPSKSGRGLQSAVGPCHCPTTDQCTCVRNFPPAEMRRHNIPPLDFRTSSFVPAEDLKTSTTEENIIIEINTQNQSREMYLEAIDIEASTLPEFIDAPGVLVVDSGCGLGCMVFAIVLPLGLVIVLVIVIVTWRIRSGCFGGNPKFESCHISLSGVVPSDYVEDSAPESRNTPSETSSFGKASLADAKWEFPRSRLQLQSVLGEGEFGKVMKAQAWNIGGVKGYSTVAVKMLKDNGGPQEKQDLMMEFMLLKEISHPNVVRLLGVSTEKSGPFYLIVEFAEMGSLRSYLRKRRRHNCCRYNNQGQLQDQLDFVPRDYYHHPCERSRYEPDHIYFHKEQLSFAWQIAKGMAYLSDMKLVHRDLAARNVLLAKQKVVKISDFGLSRDIYEGDAYLKKSRGRVPVKWMAIESLEDQIYTSRSDVWSFGVVLWEIMMQGATPYPGVTPQRLYNLLKAGYRMSKPDNCTDEMYYLMRQCWRMLPRERPSFKELVLKLDFFLQDTVEYMDFITKERSQRSHSMTDNFIAKDLTPNVQYTSVLIENDEEDDEVSDLGSDENIGLVRLFGQSQDTSSLTRLVTSTPESTA